ncbi:uncharacterized protein EAE97_004131 [Botrytis byssoidea]|uniref:Heterokaryon incompatibility domain-containing protein n=1 Tax=Botrytis byssoidea TaxID=139641 RepID=A0A9P5IM26_9HELO|nr:uncharacterized protein EAE97_004131 [Botrytis byssoidea]KAF7946882.1 hypothetical protein EAE97_004131 [Botrytis byssoidea]
MEFFDFRWKNKDFTEDSLDKSTRGFDFTPSQLSHARQTDPVRSMSRKPINWDQIEGWIEEYDSKFNHLIPERFFVLPKQFRVIDVEKDKVILAPDHCDFVALSYVWGEITSDLMLCVSNVQQLAKDFSISRIDIPATIKDAMIACAMIGKRYLWVDRLCIVQDESDDIKLAQIERMGDIYSSAFLTIVGACGNDARSGLAGIDGKTRTTAPWVISLHKIVLVEAVFHPFRGEPEAIPKWYTRAWTFQELVLSSRLLIFTEFGVYYMRNPKDKFNGNDESTFEFLSNGFLSLEIYEFEARNIHRLIETYSKRYLTYDADRIQAFSGIFNHLGIRHQSGMSWNEFDENIFWRPCLWKQASQTLGSSEATTSFPTWSWSSVAGPLRFGRHSHSVPVTTWAHFSLAEGNFVMLIPPKVERYGWHQLAHTERFYNLEHWINLRDYTNAALIPGRLLLLTQTARLRLECYGTFSGEPESPTEFSLWNEDEQWTRIVQLSKYDAETVMQMCKGGNKAFFDFASISITGIRDGPSPLYGFF